MRATDGRLGAAGLLTTPIHKQLAIIMIRDGSLPPLFIIQVEYQMIPGDMKGAYMDNRSLYPLTYIVLHVCFQVIALPSNQANSLVTYHIWLK